jgi:hypothetical protein
MIDINERIWYEDMTGMFNKDNLQNFFPSNDMNKIEKMNSFVRFSVYFSLIIFLLKKSTKVFFIPFFALVGTFVINKSENNIMNQEKFINTNDPNDELSNETKCKVPTESNPFMNVLVTDYSQNPDRKPACDVEDNNVKKSMKKQFNKNLFTSIDDVYDKNNSYRQFYTTASTTIPNDQDSFAKWLYYNEEKTCKEGNTGKCFR